MPFVTDTFSRIWQFVTQFSEAEAVSRTDLDIALDDLADGINDTSTYLQGLITALASSDLYLGAKASAPIVNNEGGALVAGNIYVGTTDYVMRVWTGSAWVNVTDLADASTFFKTLVTAASAAAFRGLLELGSAAEQASSAFATAAQGASADTALASTQFTAHAHLVPFTAGGPTAFTVTNTTPITSLAINKIQQVRFHLTNVGVATLNVDGLGAKTIKRYNNSLALTDLTDGDIVLGEVHRLRYDGTYWVLLTPIGAKTDGIRGIVHKATSAEAEEGTATDKFPDVVGVAAAIVALQRAQVWGMIDGTAGTPAASSATGIASVTDNGTGDYTIAYSNNFATANHQVSITVHGTGVVADRTFCTVAPTTGGCRVYFTDINGTRVDRDFTFIAFGTPV